MFLARLFTQRDAFVVILAGGGEIPGGSKHYGEADEWICRFALLAVVTEGGERFLVSSAGSSKVAQRHAHVANVVERCSAAAGRLDLPPNFERLFEDSLRAGEVAEHEHLAGDVVQG